MTEQQEWCLACGTAVGTRVVSAPGWRTPIAIVAAILLIAAIALAIAIVQLADDTGEVTPTTPAASPTPSPVATATPSPTTSAVPALPEASGTETPTPSAGGDADAEWPAGKSGWTVVLASESGEDAARQQADELATTGIADVGVLHSDDFSSLDPGSWVVFSGVYDSQSEASDALDKIDVKGAYIRRIEPD
jgi:septal ring-binding cell division protein DamX